MRSIYVPDAGSRAQDFRDDAADCDVDGVTTKVDVRDSHSKHM